jgi:tRNA(Ile2) C34 agmatinyltransferase TiaS
MALLVADPIERPVVLLGHTATGHREVGGGPTLDDAVVRAWEGLVAHAVTVCLLCGGRVRSRQDGGRCDRCGTILA